MNPHLFSIRTFHARKLFWAISAGIFLLYHSAASHAVDLTRKIDGMVESFMAQVNVPAVAVLVAEKGEVIHHKAYGKSDIGHDIRLTNDSAFAIGSITKQFTGFAIAQLVSGGKLSLDDPLHKYFPSFPETGRNITVRNLLNHTSGLINYTTKSIVHDNAWKDMSHEEMVAWFKDEPLLFEPGSQWHYTNSGTYLLGVIVEKVTGLSYKDYLKQNIFAPFDMTRTYLAGSRDIIPSRVTGYDLTEDGYKRAKSYSVSFPYSAGAIISTTGDLWKFFSNLHRKDLVSDEVRNILYKQEILPNGEELIYTLGCLFAGDLDGHQTYFHGGEVYGFFSHQAYFPEADVAVIVLTNRMGYFPGPSSLANKISREVMGIVQPQFVKQALAENEMGKIAGVYRLTGQSFFQSDKVIISFKDDMMMLKMGHSYEDMFELPFYSAGNGKFVMLIDDEMTFEVDLSSEAPAAYLNSGTIQFKLKKTPE